MQLATDIKHAVGLSSGSFCIVFILTWSQIRLAHSSCAHHAVQGILNRLNVLPRTFSA